MFEKSLSKWFFAASKWASFSRHVGYFWESRQKNKGNSVNRISHTKSFEVGLAFQAAIFIWNQIIILRNSVNRHFMILRQIVSLTK